MTACSEAPIPDSSILPPFTPSHACELENISADTSCQDGYYSTMMPRVCGASESVREVVIGKGSHTQLIQRDYHYFGGCWDGITSDVRSLRICDTDSGESTTLKEHIRGDPLPSPDGTWFVFNALASTHDVSIHLFRVRADGTDLTQLDTQPFPHRVVGAQDYRWSEGNAWLEVSLWDGTENGWRNYRLRTDGSGAYVALDIMSAALSRMTTETVSVATATTPFKPIPTSTPAHTAAASAILPTSTFTPWATPTPCASWVIQPQLPPTSNGSSLCAQPAVTTSGAVQYFEGGAMIWLKDPGKYYLLTRKGEFYSVHDPLTTYRDTSAQYVPPAGLYAPISGFGLVWRGDYLPDGASDAADLSAFHQDLGWATAPEFSYQTTYQCGIYLVTASGPARQVFCVLTYPDGRPIRTAESPYPLWPSGSWQALG
jgi:hypothetical protein